MAEAVGLIILESVGLESTALLTVGSATLTSATVVGQVALTTALIGASYALSAATTKSKTPANGTQSIRQAVPPRQAGYGRNLLRGYYLFYEVASGVSYDVVALHSGKVCGFKSYFLNDDEVALSTPSVFDTYRVGLTTDPATHDGRYTSAVVRIGTRLGENTETVYGDLTAAFPTLWDSNHRIDGTATMLLVCGGTKENDFLKAYPNGKPEPGAIVDQLLIWDPRDDSQDPDDPSTWVPAEEYDDATEYDAGGRVQYNGAPYISRANGNLGNTPDESEEDWIAVLTNPVLQLIDFLVDNDHGMGRDRSVMIDPALDALMAEADLCDELVLKADGSSQPRYTSNGTFSFEDDPADVLGRILSSCDGWMCETGDGTLVLTVGHYRAPSVTITADQIVNFTISYGKGDEQVVNELAMTFISPDHKYKEEAGQPWRDEDDISERGKIRSQPFSLPFVHNHPQARRLTLRSAQRLGSISGTMVCTLYGLLAQGQRWIALQYPFLPRLDDCIIEVSRVEPDLANATVAIDFTVVDPVALEDYVPSRDEGSPPPLEGFSGTAQADVLPVPEDLAGAADGEPPFHIDVNWDDPGRTDLTWRVRFRVLDQGGGIPGPWSQMDFADPTIDGGRIYVTLFPPTEDDYEVQAASVSSGGSISDWSGSLIVSTLGFSFDFSKAKNSGYLVFL